MSRLPRSFLFAVFSVLALSIFAYRSIPPYDFYGLDFHNLWTFHHCEHRWNPYLVRGAECGDVLNRDIVYPPLMYWLFGWTAWFSFPVARTLHQALIFFGTVFTVYLWSMKDQAALRPELDLRKGWLFQLFFTLSLLQLPLVFAIERGTNDIFVLLAFGGALSAMLARRPNLSAVLTGTAFSLKLYPAPAAFAVGIGYWLACWNQSRFKDGFKYALIVGLACTLPFLVFWNQTVPYLTDVIPRYNEIKVTKWIITHGIWPVMEGYEAYAMVILIALSGTWIFACRKLFLEGDAHYAFAGALAISTYFARVAHDYTLITVYPLLTLQFIRALKPDASKLSRFLVFLAFFSMGYRGWFVDFLNTRVFLQIGWLFASGIVVLRTRTLLEAARPSL
jgi:hypothetical protein